MVPPHEGANCSKIHRSEGLKPEQAQPRSTCVTQARSATNPAPAIPDGAQTCHILPQKSCCHSRCPLSSPPTAAQPPASPALLLSAFLTFSFQCSYRGAGTTVRISPTTLITDLFRYQIHAKAAKEIGDSKKHKAYRNSTETSKFFKYLNCKFKLFKLSLLRCLKPPRSSAVTCTRCGRVPAEKV